MIAYAMAPRFGCLKKALDLGFGEEVLRLLVQIDGSVLKHRGSHFTLRLLASWILALQPADPTRVA
jgi:hypothetical protein